MKPNMARYMLMAAIWAGQFGSLDGPYERREWTDVKDVDPEAVKAEIRAKKARKHRRHR